MSEKESKQEANYKDKSDRILNRCGNCSMFQPPDSCTAVRGDISPDGICKYYEKVMW